MKIKKIIIIGLGGIGSNLVSDLYKQYECEFVLIDGDFAEEKNLKRQDFRKKDIGMNKAQIIATRLNCAYERCNASYVNEFVPVNKLSTFRFMDEFTTSGSLILLCVDNHITRNAIYEFFEESKLTDLWLIDAANGMTSADCFSICRSTTGVQGIMRKQIDPDVEIDKSDNPHESCGNLLDNGNKQTLLANIKAATLTLECIVDNKVGWFKYE